MKCVLWIQASICYGVTLPAAHVLVEFVYIRPENNRLRFIYFFYLSFLFDTLPNLEGLRVADINFSK